MQVGELPPSASALLEKFEAVGGCVNYVVIDPEGDDPTLEDTVRSAAVLAVELLIARYARPPSLWRPVIDKALASAMRGSLINPQSFLGPRWSQERQSLIVQQQVMHRHMSMWFHVRDVPIEANAIADFSQSTDIAKGYAYVFTDPPYGLRIKGAAVQDLFDSINADLLPDLAAPATRIWKWPTDWSTFFDPGHEWWGSFLWTIAQEHRAIMCIVASTTD